MLRKGSGGSTARAPRRSGAAGAGRQGQKPWGVMLALATVALGTPAAAHAEDPAYEDLPSHLSIGGELGIGTVFTRFRQDDVLYGDVVQLSVRGAIDLSDRWAFMLALKSWALPSNNYAFFVMPGFRWEPLRIPLGRLFADASVGPAATGGGTRLGFDVGVGFEIDTIVVPGLSFGPVFRYMQVFNTDPSYSDDGRAWSLGGSITYHFGRAAAGQPKREVTRVEVPRAKSVASMVDSDGDGLRDDVDECPDAAPGPHPDPRRRGCPLPDRDHDGVPDESDACPDDAPGPHPDPSRPGCPIADRDHDGIPDAEDKCPDQAGAPSRDASKNGCPGMVAIEAGKLTIKEKIEFAAGGDRLLPASTPILEAVADTLLAAAYIKKVAIQGHTDNQGSDEKNLELSQKRADAVRTWLIGKGVAADRLDAQGFGSTQPIASNKTTAGRAANRRVEFVVVE